MDEENTFTLLEGPSQFENKKTGCPATQSKKKETEKRAEKHNEEEGVPANPFWHVEARHC